MLKAIHDFSTFDYCVAGALIALAIAVLGVVTNAVLRDAGFGIVVNGLLVSCGLVAGVCTRAVTLGFH